MAEILLSKRDVRRFLLAKQGLWPPRALVGVEGILQVFNRVGSIQFDPLNLVGRNPDLVLQSRVADYRAEMVYELAYEKRKLYDYWDKMMCLLPLQDWPNLALLRERWRERHLQRLGELAEHVQTVLSVIRQRGPMSSLDFEEKHNVGWKTEWRWGPLRASKAILEMLADTGQLMVSYRLGARRYYDLSERILPDAIAREPELKDEEAFLRWRVARRCQGIGLVGPALGGEVWAGVGKAAQRDAATAALVEQGEMAPLRIEDDKRTYYLLTRDLPFLEQARSTSPAPQVAFIAPLDNLLWSRSLIERLFGFRYVWEVYKPVQQRQFGYYVLPVLYGDRFVARLEPKYDRETGVLHILSWHWEPDESLSDPLADALHGALSHFVVYLGAMRVIPSPDVDPDVAAAIAGVEH